MHINETTKRITGKGTNKYSIDQKYKKQIHASQNPPNSKSPDY